MAALPPIRNITKEDLRGAPEWINFLLSPLNQFMNAVYNALDRNLTLGENLAANTVKVSFKTTSDYDFATWQIINLSNPIKDRPTCVLIGDIKEKDSEKNTIITAAPFPVWDYLNGQIRIKFITGLIADKRYNVTFLVL
jgi:hypothetical protein